MNEYDKKEETYGQEHPILREIIYVLETELDDTAYAQDHLDSHFQHRLLMNVGDVFTIGEYAQPLRLNITQEECSTVLDYVAEQKMVTITVDHVEQVVWDLFGNWFVEP